MRVHNELLERSPWHLGTLYTPFAIDLRGEEREGEPPVYYRPVYSYYGGALSCGANATYIRSGQERVGRPLNAAQAEAIDTFYDVCEQHTLSMDLEPGDLQLLNSYVTLHDRTAYDDYDEPERKRHMLRLWLDVPNRRPLAPDFGTYDFAPAASSACARRRGSPTSRVRPRARPASIRDDLRGRLGGREPRGLTGPQREKLRPPLLRRRARHTSSRFGTDTGAMFAAHTIRELLDHPVWNAARRAPGKSGGAAHVGGEDAL